MLRRLFRRRPPTGIAPAIPRFFELDQPIPPFRSAELLEHCKLARERLTGVWRQSDRCWAEIVQPVLERAAEHFQLMPASQNTHHVHVAGLLDHTLETAALALRGLRKRTFPAPAAADERRRAEDAWEVAALMAGLLHDIGKPLTDITVRGPKTSPIHANSGVAWHGELPFLAWCARHGLDRYRWSWRAGRGFSHVSALRQGAKHVVTPELELWLRTTWPPAHRALDDYIAGTAPEGEFLPTLVAEADRDSVRAYLARAGRGHRSEAEDPLIDELSLVLERILQLGDWRLNEPGSPLWLTTAGLFLIWPGRAGRDLRERINRRGKVVAPATDDELAQHLVDRLVAVAGTDGLSGEPTLYWRIYLPGQAVAVTAVRIRDPRFVLPVGMGQAPVPVSVPPSPLPSGPLRLTADRGAAADALLTPGAQPVAAAAPVPATPATVAPTRQDLLVDDGLRRLLQGMVRDEAPLPVGNVPVPPKPASGPTMLSSASPSAPSPSLSLPARKAAQPSAGASAPATIALPIPSHPAVAVPEDRLPPVAEQARQELTALGEPGLVLLAIVEDLLAGRIDWAQSPLLVQAEAVALAYPAWLARYAADPTTLMEQLDAAGLLVPDPSRPGMLVWQVDPVLGCRRLMLAADPARVVLVLLPADLAGGGGIAKQPPALSAPAPPAAVPPSDLAAGPVAAGATDWTASSMTAGSAVPTPSMASVPARADDDPSVAVRAFLAWVVAHEGQHGIHRAEATGRLTLPRESMVTFVQMQTSAPRARDAIITALRRDPRVRVSRTLITLLESPDEPAEL